MKYLFEENQKFTQWWLWVILLSFPIISFGPFDENAVNINYVLIGFFIPFLFYLFELRLKVSASDIDILCDFTRETVKMEVDIKPPSDNKNKANITWIKDQVELCKKRNTDLFSSFEYEIWIDSDIKFYKDSIRTQFTNIESLYENEVVKQKKEIVGFKVILIRDFKNNFGSKKMFVEGIEKMLLNYYEGIVQYLKNAPKKAPKIKQEPITTQQ
jgi:hypothetical protein